MRAFSGNVLSELTLRPTLDPSLKLNGLFGFEGRAIGVLSALQLGVHEFLETWHQNPASLQEPSNLYPRP